MSRERYEKLFRELNARHLRSGEAERLIAELGAPAQAFRGFSFARRHTWASARADFRAALAASRGASPLIEWVCGAGLFLARDYDRAIAALESAERADERQRADKRGVGARARKLGLELCTLLGWYGEARALRERIASEDLPTSRDLSARTQELRRQAAIRRRAEQARAGSPSEAAHKCYALALRDGPEAARAGLSELRRKHAGQLEPLRRAIQLELLTGQLDEVARLLGEAEAEHGAALRVEAAALAYARGQLESCELGEDEQGRALYFRGLQRAQAGEHAQAGELLERARVHHPGSVAVALALALARHDADPSTYDEGTRHRFTELLDWAPALLSDAAAALELELWDDEGQLRGREAQIQIMRQAHAMLSPEHDLGVSSYRGPRGQLRHVAPIGRPPTHRARIEAKHDPLLERHESVLVWDIGVRPRPPRAREAGEAEARAPQDPRGEERGPWTPRLLSPEQIEQFLRDGFITLPKALDPEFTARVREDAIRRIREEPERWVRGYDPADRRRSLSEFDPARPRTWTWQRIALSGPDLWKIEDIAPSVWMALCDLLGGPGRIETDSWGNYLLLALRHHGYMGRAQPGPDAEGWHIDDPGPSTRLTNIRNGIVCIALYDDVLPDSGNTWLCPDSVPAVARELAAHPEGVDFVTKRGSYITERCLRFHEVSGESGDVLLCHPLLMHSASTNKSDRVRWMANPMIYLAQPLDPFREPAALSPVELAIHRAIEGGAAQA